MTYRFPRVLLLSVLCASPAVAEPQAAQPVASPQAEVAGATATLEALRGVLSQIDRTDRAKRPEQTYTAEVQLAALGQPADATNTQRKVGPIAPFLVDAHIAYKHEKARLSDVGVDCGATPAIPACAALMDVRKLVHRLLFEEGLYWPVAAVLRTSFVQGEASDELGTRLERSTNSSEMTGAVLVDFETKHFGDEASKGMRPDFALGGRMGFAPELALVCKAPAASTEGGLCPMTQPLTPHFQNGFGWEMAGRTNWNMSAAEIGLLVRTGQTRLNDLSVVLGTKEAPITAVVARNGIGKWAWHHEIGAEFRYYGKDLSIAHHDAGTLISPLLGFAAGWRKDNRFTPVGDLADFTLGNRRYFLRASVNVMSYVINRDKAEAEKAGTLRVVIENDWARGKVETGTPRVPRATRLFVEGSVDMPKLGIGKPKDPPK